MDILSTLVYGLIQGLTEFLPVSSSGHLALLPHVMKIDDPGVAFDLTMHVGTAFAVMIYFRKEVLELFKQLWACRKLSKETLIKNSYCVNFITSTIVTVILAFLIKDFASTVGRSVMLISVNLIVFGIIMFIADMWGSELPNGQMNSNLKLKESLLIGLFQGMAVFPGVSRSGATLTISRFLGLSREEASRYSFLLSLPIIFGGFILKLPEINSSTTINLQSCLLGGLISLIVGLITIHFFLKFIKRMGLWTFSLYRIVFAIVILKFLH